MSAPPSSTALRRIRADVMELAKNPSPLYKAAPLEDDFFEWHFTVRGPAGTDFAGGIYHGRILLPPEYPFKPPSIMLLTPNGRFEINTKICLSLTAHHPEHWQPAWGIRTILEALIAFFPTPADGSIGALNWTPEERRDLALRSRSWVCPECGPIADLLEPDTTAPEPAPVVPEPVPEPPPPVVVQAPVAPVEQAPVAQMPEQPPPVDVVDDLRWYDRAIAFLLVLLALLIYKIIYYPGDDWVVQYREWQESRRHHGL